MVLIVQHFGRMIVCSVAYFALSSKSYGFQTARRRTHLVQ